MKFTRAAKAYIESTRALFQKENPGVATWFDVAAAYDAGLLHGANRTRDAREQLTELGVVTREHRGGIHCSCADCRCITDVQIL